MKILVLGDLILDIYTQCECSKISPEAPVPVLCPRKSERKLGGAANVAACLAALGAKTTIASVLGDDEVALIIENELKNQQITPILLREKGRISSKKERLLAMSNQIARIDYESPHPISELSTQELINQLDEHYDAIVLSDYAKGALNKNLVQAALKRSKLVLADPKDNLELFRGVSIITPNLKEARRFAGEIDINDEASLYKALKFFEKEFDIKCPIITLSERGIAALNDTPKSQQSSGCNKIPQNRSEQKTLEIVPTKANEVYDVTGAGDSVIAALAFALASGKELKSALQFANAAAAITVSKIGTYAPKLAEINSSENKIISLESACELARGKKLVWTNGCFDVLHAGHVSYLASAKKLGDMLIVGLNSDASVKALKGPQRPINSAQDRASVLAALKSVDFVVIFDELTPLKCIQALRPSVLVKGADYQKDEVIGAEFAESVELIDFLPGRSSTKIINKCKEIE